MTKKEWRAFSKTRDHYREVVRELDPWLGKLKAAQQELVNRRSGPAYIVETPAVYNEALDDLGPGDEIKLILVGDNPGRREQAAENRRYLVGPSGKIAEKFFRDNPGLGIDFRKNVIILNKTPVHTPRTAELRELCCLEKFAGLISESQKTMARLLLEFHAALGPVPVWIIGYSEMKKKGIFEVYTNTLQDLYGPGPIGRGGPSVPKALLAALRAELFLYRHFSMNQFTIDLRQQAGTGETAGETLDRIGRAYRLRILGW